MHMYVCKFHILQNVYLGNSLVLLHVWHYSLPSIYIPIVSYWNKQAPLVMEGLSIGWNVNYVII